MKFTPLSALPDAFLIEPLIFEDQRGFFMETYRAQEFASAVMDVDFVQDNHSLSYQGTLRGLHYQIRQPQGKLVRVVVGEIFDVIVDIRRSSSTFGKWVGNYLSTQNRLSAWIPPGFAHGFYVVSPVAEIIYKATDYFAPQWERTLLWNDPMLGIQWPLKEGERPLLSDKDLQGCQLSQADLFD